MRTELRLVEIRDQLTPVVNGGRVRLNRAAIGSFVKPRQIIALHLVQTAVWDDPEATVTLMRRIGTNSTALGHCDRLPVSFAPPAGFPVPIRFKNR